MDLDMDRPLNVTLARRLEIVANKKLSETI
jgi:hypothetical protein